MLNCRSISGWKLKKSFVRNKLIKKFKYFASFEGGDDGVNTIC